VVFGQDLEEIVVLDFADERRHSCII
jgi:hypothetical protein